MRGPHVTVRGNAKKYYCSPYGSRALSGRERRWKGGGNFLEKGGAPPFSPPFHRPPFPPTSKTFDLIESLPPCFPVGKSPSPPTGSKGNNGFIPRRQPSQKQKPPERYSDGFFIPKPIFPLTPERTPAAPPPHQSKVFGEEEERFGGGKETFSESFPFPPPIFYSPPSFSECSFLKMVLRLTLKTSATFWTEPCTLRALRRMPRSMSAMMSLRGRS